MSGQQVTSSTSGRVRDVKPGDLDYKSNALPTRVRCLPREVFLSSFVSVMAHCPGRGEEILVGDMAHIILWEQGGVAQVITIT